MENHRPDRRKSLFTRLAALGLACSSLALVNCSGGGGTSLPRAPVGGGTGATPAPTGSPSVSPSSSPSAVPSSSPSGVPSTAPSGVPTPTATPTSTPTSTPTATPTATPTSVPTSGPTSGPGFACTTPSATFGPSYYASVIVIGNVPAGGGAFGADSSNSLWIKASYSPAAPTPTPTPTSTPSTAPSAPPTRPFYVYTGTYHINSANAPTDGCLTMFTTTDGSNINGATFSSEGIGFVNPPQTTYTENLGAVGHITAVALNVSPNAPNQNGTIALDSGDSGTISITSVQTVQLPLSRIRDPRAFVKKH
ncbi:MAG: hypothetical protein JWM87_3580 [Candidatus Eremiobacteraeota bacterium]|nr:hypothetical protein [Candidatus Eremiobacteraeota bacterium]